MNAFMVVCAAAGSPGRSRAGLPEERTPSGEDQEVESVSVKERLAMYQAAVSKTESSSSSSAAVRQSLLRMQEETAERMSRQPEQCFD